MFTGIIEDLDAMNPISIFRGFMEGNNPPCTEITMPTKTSKNVIGSSAFHVSNGDIQDMAPCDFPSKTNPISKVSCESFVGSAIEKQDLKSIYIFMINPKQSSLVRFGYKRGIIAAKTKMILFINWILPFN